MARQQNRREFLMSGASLIAAVGAGLSAGCASAPEAVPQKGISLRKEDFYQGGVFDEHGVNHGGKFDAARAMQAYIDCWRRLGYPVYPALAQGDLQQNPNLRFWAVDFAKGDFLKFGMGGVIWVNEVREEYFGHDIYLLPGQSIAEHRHVATHLKAKDVHTGISYEKDVPAKMESWLVRHGWVYGFSEVGEPNLDKFPEAKARLSSLYVTSEPGKNLLRSSHVEKWTADGIAHKLPKEGSWHFMMGGEEGAVVTEFANFHDGAGLRFSVPGVRF